MVAGGNHGLGLGLNVVIGLVFVGGGGQSVSRRRGVIRHVPGGQVGRGHGVGHAHAWGHPMVQPWD